ncbi:MAG TPA: MFS transporter [Anaerolineaceae bacterium]|nr:MFS transporter [Anaerolineaceae bacterium]HPN50212.1 MFS transporter [Anaerolineaceae bacterium]
MTKPFYVLSLCCVVFLGLGIVTAALGPALPELAIQNATDLGTIGVLFTALFLGAMTAQVAAGFIGNRIPPKTMFLAGLGVMGVALIGLYFSRNLLLTVVCGVMVGLGHGTVDLDGTVMIADAYEGRQVSALNALHLFFGIGAVGGPYIVSLAMQNGIPAVWSLIAGGMLMLVCAPVMLVMKVRHQTAVPQETRKNGSVLKSALMWLLAFYLLFYVGIETGLGGWVAAYLNQTTGMALANGAMAASGFWLALTIGRLTAALLGRRFSPLKVLLFSVMTSLAGAILLPLSTGQQTLSLVAVLLTGLGFGPMFPTTVAAATEFFPEERARAASICIAMGSVGGMILPWLQGIILQNMGPYSAILFVTIGVVMMVVLHSGQRVLYSQAHT